MRFDDTLETVMAADLTEEFARRAAYRQLVDLIGRGRVTPEPRAIAIVERLARQIPLTQRSAAARGLAFAQPPFELVRVFARDDLAVAAPLLRTATLSSADWCALLPELSPSARAILRHRRDLGSDVERALQTFGSVDFVLTGEVFDNKEDVVSRETDLGFTFATFDELTLDQPILEPAPEDRPEVAEVVARLDAFRDAVVHDSPRFADPLASADDRVRFETDGEGTIRWADGLARGPLIGLSLRLAGGGGVARVDATAAGAFRQRARFCDARLRIEGSGPAAGDWLMSGKPIFDASTGRFIGYRGTARRPHPGETARPSARDLPDPDGMRQLTHELRTPTNAIIGFSEMIALQVLGPVDEAYRDYAGAIGHNARGLLGAIDDLDMAARIESDALTLRSETVSLRAALGAVLLDLAPLAELRGATIVLPDTDVQVRGDRNAVERLFGRLIATLLSAMGRGERLVMMLSLNDDSLSLSISRPASLPDQAEAGGEVSEEVAAFSALPLGTGFALRLAGNLARELGGGIYFGPDAIDVRLPAGEGGARTATKS